MIERVHELGLTERQLQDPVERLARLAEDYGESLAARILADETINRAERLRSCWRSYQRRHDTNRPPFAPTIEQLPHFPEGELQIALV